MWLDPSRDDPAWEHPTDGAVAGLPQLVEGSLVVADQSGKIVALDPVSGKPAGAGYALAGSVVPVTSPVAFGPGRLFVPLSDGTAVLLDIDKLKKPQS